jgi:F-type H+-transporting ATPase subunit gamma
MAGGQERALRTRIRTVNSTKKITRAMELIAGSRIVKAMQRLHAAVPYSDQITEVVRDLAAAGGDVQSPLFVPRPQLHRAGHIVLVADRGLCGGYNVNVLRATEAEIKADALAGLDYSIIVCGRKGESYFRFRGYRTDAIFTGFSENPTYADAKRVAAAAVELYVSGQVDRIEIVYTRFVSAGFQEVVQRPLIPLDAELLAGGDGRPAGAAEQAAGGYEFEPDPSSILETLLPRYVEARVFAALLNASASEQAARQRAMKAATDNAEELIKTLTRIMNRARQDSITTEIMEIVSGAEALGGEKATGRQIIQLYETVDI